MVGTDQKCFNLTKKRGMCRYAHVDEMSVCDCIHCHRWLFTLLSRHYRVWSRRRTASSVCQEHILPGYTRSQSHFHTSLRQYGLNSPRSSTAAVWWPLSPRLVTQLPLFDRDRYTAVRSGPCHSLADTPGSKRPCGSDHEAVCRRHPGGGEPVRREQDGGLVTGGNYGWRKRRLTYTVCGQLVSLGGCVVLGL